MNRFIVTGLILGKKSNKSKHFHVSAKNGKIFNRKAKKVKKINKVLISFLSVHANDLHWFIK